MTTATDPTTTDLAFQPLSDSEWRVTDARPTLGTVGRLLGFIEHRDTGVHVIRTEPPFGRFEVPSVADAVAHFRRYA